VWKEPIQGRRLVRRLNIDGDAQGDLAGHGGEQRAVFVYQMDSYRYWERELQRHDFTFGQFGEDPSISFARTGLTVAWDSRFQNLLELAEACDVPVRWSCRTGVCHMCESGLGIGYETWHQASGAA
jgi:ferredoxin